MAYQLQLLLSVFVETICTNPYKVAPFLPDEMCDITFFPRKMVALYHSAFFFIIRYILCIIIHKKSENIVTQQLLGFVDIEVCLQDRQLSFVEVSVD
jgi:hypothetical protein